MKKKVQCTIGVFSRLTWSSLESGKASLRKWCLMWDLEDEDYWMRKKEDRTFQLSMTHVWTETGHLRHWKSIEYTGDNVRGFKTRLRRQTGNRSWKAMTLFLVRVNRGNIFWFSPLYDEDISILSFTSFPSSIPQVLSFIHLTFMLSKSMIFTIISVTIVFML